MNAILFDTFGSSSVLRIGTVPLPDLRPGEVRIRIRHTSVNPVDWKIREGLLAGMFPHVFPVTPGWDAAGEVEALGEGVQGLAVGDVVYAYTRLPEVHNGTYAEYVTVPASAVARAPATLTTGDSAGIPLVGLTAWQVLHDVARVQPGERVLVTGGAGSVGSYAVQFARIAGATVTATASRKNQAYLRELGVKHPVDYTSGLADALTSASPEGFGVIIDTVGGDALIEASAHLREGGRLVSIVSTPPNGRFHFVSPSGAQLAQIAALIDKGEVRPARTRVISVTDAASAQDEVRSGHSGKLVLAIDFA